MMTPISELFLSYKTVVLLFTHHNPPHILEKFGLTKWVPYLLHVRISHSELWLMTSEKIWDELISGLLVWNVFLVYVNQPILNLFCLVFQSTSSNYVTHLILTEPLWWSICLRSIRVELELSNESNSLDQIITKFGNFWLHKLPRFNQISSRSTVLNVGLR